MPVGLRHWVCSLCIHRLSGIISGMAPEFVFKGEIWFVFVYSKFSLQRLVSLSGTFSLFLLGVYVYGMRWERKRERSNVHQRTFKIKG